MWYIGVAILILAQAAFIGFLLLEHQRRTKVEADREKTAEALRESESRNRAILEALPDLMFLLDERGTYLDWYANDQRGLYVPPEQFLGKTIQDVLPLEVSQRCMVAIGQVLSSGQPARLEYSLQIGKETLFFETRLVKLKDRTVLAIARDITELKRAEIELQHLSTQLLNLQDDERRRIARELHDTTAQHLFAITINLENLRRTDYGISPAGVELLSECRELCESSLQEVRTLAYLRHPTELEHTGLISALRWFVEGFRKRTGVVADLQVPSELAPLPLEMENDLFRVVQEGLFNVFKHSGSPSATVVLKGDEEHVLLQIKDDGHGMTYGTTRIPIDPPIGAGVSIIRERLRRWGGHLTIESNGGGVLLSVQVPVKTDNTKSNGGWHPPDSSMVGEARNGE